MANAATELAAILRAWRVKTNGNTIYGTRAGASPGDIEFWDQQVSAVGLLSRVRQIIDDLRAGGEDVSDYEASFPRWARVLFAPDVQWNAPTGQSELAGATDVGLLASLGHVVKREPVMMPMNAEVKKTIRGGLDDVVELLAEDDCPLNESQKAYVLRLINAIRRLLDDVEVQGSADLVSNLNEIYGYLAVVAKATAASSPSFAAKLRDAADRMMPALYAGAMFGMGLIGTAADIKALTGS